MSELEYDKMVDALEAANAELRKRLTEIILGSDCKGDEMNAEEIARKLASGWYADETDGEEKELLTNGLATQIERALIAYGETANAELKRRAVKLAEALREVRQWMNEPISANEAERIKRELELLNKIDAALREWEQRK